MDDVAAGSRGFAVEGSAVADEKRDSPRPFDVMTVEYSTNVTHGNASVRMMPGRAYYGPARDYKGSMVSVEYTRAGISSISIVPWSVSITT